jgi:hypothetical protein
VSAAEQSAPPASEGAYEGWAIVELFGHVKLAGQVREAVQYGTRMLRLEVPAIDGRPGFTTFKGGGALYALTPCSEEVARALLKRLRPEPVARYEIGLPPQLEPVRDAEVAAEDADDDDDPAAAVCGQCGGCGEFPVPGAQCSRCRGGGEEPAF